MLSICIPIFNVNVVPFVNELFLETSQFSSSTEIILIDDASNNDYRAKNENLKKITNYIQLNQNIGRAKIRNLFVQYAKYEYLLFLDCDGRVISPFFISSYLDIFKKETQSSVVCGGRVYPNLKPSRKFLLNWEYGLKKETISLNKRKAKPYNSFMTNNFVIKKSILKKIKFNESIQKYGHEDTLFGFSLQHQNIELTHIDNPILNADYELNSDYLKKVESSIDNLIYILKSYQDQNQLIQNIKILTIFNIIKNRNLLWLLMVLTYISAPLLKLMLIKGYYFNISVLNFYKLGLLNKKINR